MTENNQEQNARDNGFIDCILTIEEFSLSEEERELLFGDGIYSPEEKEEMKRKQDARNAERVPAHEFSVTVTDAEYIKSYGFGGANSRAHLKIGRVRMHMDDFEIHRMCEEGRKLMSQPKETVYGDEHQRNAYFMIGGAPCRLFRGSTDQITGELRDSYSWYIGAISLHLTRRQLHNLLWELEQVKKRTGELREKYRSETR